MTADKRTPLVPKLRFPEFQDASEWSTLRGDALFDSINNRNAGPGLPVLAITQEHGAIPRDQIDYHVSVTAESVASYKEVCVGDFIISLRSFQGGIEYSRHHGICSPAYEILRRKGGGYDHFFRHLFKSDRFIQQLTRNIEGLRDGKMISYTQFSEQRLTVPGPPEQQKIADCLDSLDDLIAAEGRKLEAMRQHKEGLMQQLFPQPGETVPHLRFPEFQNGGEWEEMSIQEMIDKRLIVGHLDGNHGELYPTSEEFTQDKDGIPYISANDFVNGAVDFSKCKRLPIQRARLFKKGVAKDGDILFAHNATVGPVAKLSTAAEFVILSTTATYFRCNVALLLNDFLKFCLTSPTFIGQYSSVMSQSTRNQVPITTQRKLKLYSTSFLEQHRIAACLSALDALIAVQNQKLDALKTHKQGLMQQLFPSLEGAMRDE